MTVVFIALFPGKSTKELKEVKNAEKYGVTWHDFLFGLIGSTIFILSLHFFTNS